MKKINLFDVVSVNEFSLYFKETRDVQDALNMAYELHADLMKDSYQNIGTESRKKRKVEGYKKRLQEIKEKLPELRVLISSDEIEEKKKSVYSFELQEYEQEIERLEGELKNKNIGQVIGDRFDSFVNKEYGLSLNEWAMALGEWYATGALGEGTVTYGKQSFTAEIGE